MTPDFKKAFDYLDNVPYNTLTYQSFEEANRIAGNPFPPAVLKAMWDKAAQGCGEPAVLLKEAFREMVTRY